MFVALNDRPTARYRCYDGDGRLLYVGMSTNPEGRLMGHRLYAPWWPDMVRTVVDWYPDRYAAREAELQAMREESSVHNKEGLTLPAQGMPKWGTRWALDALRMSGEGASALSIAKALGVSPDRVRFVLRINALERRKIRPIRL